MSTPATVPVTRYIDIIDGIMSDAEAAFRLTQRARKQEIREMLPSCTDEELLRFAEDCGAEQGPEHCWRCAAWELYVERTIK